MTAVMLTVTIRTFMTGYPPHYDSMELERRYCEQVQKLPVGATVRLNVGSIPPTPEFLGWHRYGLNYLVNASDTFTARQWFQMLNEDICEILGTGVAA